MPRNRSTSVFLLAFALAPGLAVADAPGGAVEIHGYGAWSYGRSDSDVNRYHESTRDGDAGYHSLALTLSSQATERVKVSAQVWWESTAADDEQTATIDYAFGEWRHSDPFRLRIGQIKHPFGIYTEIFDVGTLRPLFWLPEGIYGQAGIVAEAYRGAGLTGTFFRGGQQFDYDLYVGETDLESQGVHAADGEGMEEEPDEVALRDLAGGRLTVVPGGVDLRLGLSAYTGRAKGETAKRHSTLGAQAEWNSGSWSVRSEFVVAAQSTGTDVQAWYLEASRTLGRGVQLAARVDRSRTTLGEGADAFAPSYLDHEDLTAGLNYWFAPDLVAKFSASRVHGNRFARPEDPGASLAEGEPEQTTKLISLGVQFAF